MTFLLFGCEKEPEAPDYSEFVHVVKRGSFELYLPPYLYPDRTISKKAAIAYTDSLHNNVFTVYREAIPDTRDDSILITTDEYAIYAAQGLSTTVADLELSTRDTMHLSGHETIIMTFTGEYASLPVWYGLMVVKTEDYFFQVSAWTLQQYADTNGRDLYHAMLSFRAYR